MKYLIRNFSCYHKNFMDDSLIDRLDKVIKDNQSRINEHKNFLEALPKNITEVRTKLDEKLANETKKMEDYLKYNSKGLNEEDRAKFDKIGHDNTDIVNMIKDKMNEVNEKNPSFLLEMIKYHSLLKKRVADNHSKQESIIYESKLKEFNKDYLLNYESARNK